MADADEGPTDSAKTKADAMALAEQAEAEAAAAEALAAAARARARAIRLRREAEAEAAAAADEPDTQTVEAAEVPDAGDTGEEPGAAVTEAAEVTDTGETGASEAPPLHGPATRRRWLRMPSLAAVAIAAAIIVICGLFGVSGYMWWHHQDAIQERHRAAAFAAGAKQGVINMTSLDFNRAKEDVQRVIDSSTGEFLAEFQLRAADFTSVVEQSKVVTEGTVNSAAVESMDEHSAVVLVAATSRVTNSAGAKEEPRAWRLRVTVTDEGGQIKMAKVEFVP